jgi:hypothetical protein
MTSALAAPSTERSADGGRTRVGTSMTNLGHRGRLVSMRTTIGNSPPAVLSQQSTRRSAIKPDIVFSSSTQTGYEPCTIGAAVDIACALAPEQTARRSISPVVRATTAPTIVASATQSREGATWCSTAVEPFRSSRTLPHVATSGDWTVVGGTTANGRSRRDMMMRMCVGVWLGLEGGRLHPNARLHVWHGSIQELLIMSPVVFWTVVGRGPVGMCTLSSLRELCWMCESAQLARLWWSL